MEEIRTWRIRYKEKNLQELEIVHKFLQKEMEEKRLQHVGEKTELEVKSLNRHLAKALFWKTRRCECAL